MSERVSMKRGKDDEKVLGPMFPRLHVNDTDKGGPRAPPRNKMALYEQLSIPSHRFNPSVLPVNPNSTSNAVPPASSSQGTGPDRNYAFSVHLPQQAPNCRAEKCVSHQSDGVNLNASLAALEQRKKVDDDDFRVPVYMHSKVGQSLDKTRKSIVARKLTSTGSRLYGCSVEVQNDCDRDPKQIGSEHVQMRKDVRSKGEGLPKISPSKEPSVKSYRNISNGDNIDNLVRQAKVTANLEYQDGPLVDHSRLSQGDACLQKEAGVGSQVIDIGHGDGPVESIGATEKRNDPLPRGCFHSKVDQSGPVEAINVAEFHDKRTGGVIHRGNLDKSENFSKVSVVDNISSLKLSPDDIVGIIGQKHFWKARRAIVNQQRVFAVQVFELHRLIKVQQLIAGSPDVLVEDCAFLGKSPPKGSSPKTVALEYVVKPREQNLKHKDDSEKQNHKMECSAENAVGKTSLSSVQNGSHLSNYTPFSGNPYQTNVGADNRMGPWCFNQSPGHQWLIPVMSPSEGLVYKPYPGPGFTGATCGGCGSFGPPPMGNNFMNPAHGVPASHQGIGVLPDTPPGSHAYFPPYGIPIMDPAMSGSAVEQMNQFARPGSHGQNGHSSGGEANFHSRNQSSFNLPFQTNGAISQPQITKLPASIESELQGSTASSPGEMAQGISNGRVTEGRDALSPFPMAPVISEKASEPHDIRQPTRVIKVVPHNSRSATESVARIFQSIQEGRKQHDSVSSVDRWE